jgi:hypothetical protein
MFKAHYDSLVGMIVLKVFKCALGVTQWVYIFIHIGLPSL